jgi:hypothetical protein
MAIFSDGEHYMSIGEAAATSSRLMIHTGPRIPSNILSEVDRKLDDGNANTGGFVFNSYDPEGTQPAVAECVSTTASKHTEASNLHAPGVAFYRYAGASPPVEANCGGSASI